MKLNLILLCGLFSAVEIARAADTKDSADWLLISPIEGASVATQTEKQKDFLALPRETRLARFADANARIELARAGWQEPCSLRWQGGTAPYEVSLTRQADGSVWWSGVVTNTHTEVYNLEIGCAYEWSVKDAAGRYLTEHFKTEDFAPRFLSHLGPYNCRDFGGWVGLDGRRVKQELAFRTAGLNYNSTPGFTSAREGKALDTKGVVAALEAPLKAQLNFWETNTADDVSWVSVEAPRAWRVASVMRPKPIQDLEWLVGQGSIEFSETRNVDSAYGIDFHGIGDGWVILEAKLHASQAGYARLGIGGDWFWALAVNDLPVRDRLLGGNGRVPCGIDNHLVAFPVQEGSNTLRVLLGAGSSGFRWFAGPAHEQPFKTIQANEKKYLDYVLKKLWERPSEVKPGASRVSKSECARWINQFGVKTELDLRSEGETRGMTGSPLGSSVEWIRVTCLAYQNIHNAKGREGIREVLRVMLDSTKYPLVFHCIGGRDRTGTIAFLLNGLLGVAEEDLFRDWESTGFCLSNMGFQHKGSFIPLVQSFDQYPGQTLNARIEAYIKSLGFTGTEIERYRAFMLEPIEK